MDRVISLLMAFALVALVVVGATLAYDRHPTWDFTFPAPIRWVLPDSLKHVHLESLESDRDAKVALANQRLTALNQCSTSIAAQNAAVDGLKRESDARVAASQNAASAAQSSASAYQRKAAAILSSQRGSQDACAAADALILREAGQ